MKLSILAYIIKKVQQGLGIVQDTDTATRAISSGKYVFWKNKFKKASTNIAENDTLSMSNLVDVNDGALNEIADHIVTYGNAVELFSSAQSSGAKTVPSLSQFRYIILYLGWDPSNNYVNASSCCIVPYELFKSNIIRPQGDVHDGTTRHYADMTYTSDTQVSLNNLTNISGSWKLWAYGIK